MSESDITHGVLYSKEEHESLYKPTIGVIVENYEQENKMTLLKEQEKKDKLDILLTMSKEELEALKFMANENVKQKKHHERNKFGGNYIPHSIVELEEEVKNLEDDLTLHEETSFEFQEENQRLRKMIRVLTDEILDLTEDCERYCRYKDADKCSTMVCPDCIIKWAEQKVEEMEENKNDKN